MTVGPLQIDMKVSLGNIIAIIMMVVSVTMAYAAVDTKVSLVDRDRLADKAASLERDIRQDETLADLKAIQAEQARTQTQLNTTMEVIRVDVGYLRRNVEEAKRVAGE